MSNVCAEYSGIVIDQNVVTASLAPGGSFYYQEFRLPEDYQRGVKEGQTRFPGISGFQILAEVAEGAASPDAEVPVKFNYTIEQHNFGNSSWEVLAKGFAVGAQAEGERIWIDAILGTEIPIDVSMTTNVSELRIGIQIVSGITKLYYATPNPLPGFVEAVQSDGSTPLAGKDAAPASFAFRLLGLVADAGTDFLGDPYRSVAIHSSAQAPVGGNTNTGFWLSAPQPSRFAVTSHYSDLRQFPETPIYGVINRLLNPSFEYDLLNGQPFAWQTSPDFREDDTPPPEVPAEERFDTPAPPVEVIGPGEYRQALQATLPFGVEFMGHHTENRSFRQVLRAALNFDESFENQAVLKVVNEPEAQRGLQSLEISTAEHGAKRFHDPEGAYAQVGVALAKPITFSVWVRSNVGKFSVVLAIGDDTVGMAEGVVTINPEWQRFSVTLASPLASGMTSVTVRTLQSETRARIFYIDSAMAQSGTKATVYVDGDQPSCKWENQKGRSGSVELTEPQLVDNAAVIDSIILDPITPGVAFNVYYTNDLTGSEGGGEMTEEEWEQKLWVHVPQSYVTSVKTTYVLPEPITARFVKIEFSQLQPRPYEPGDYQKPTGYKLFPDWVATPFLAELALPSFVAKRVGVVYDALELAYKPLINDLIQGPSSPEHPTPTPTIAPPASNRADPETLKQIELAINTFLKPPAVRAHPLTLLGVRASANSSAQANYPVESKPEFHGPINNAVSTLNRQAIVLDESIPVMFFWVTCRHEYKEAKARFENDRAYFAGLKELSFLRSQFSVAADTALYLEAGTDDTNTERSDFNVETYPVENNGAVLGEESVWFTY